MNDIHALYDRWLEKATADPDLIRELQSVAGDADDRTSAITNEMAAAGRACTTVVCSQ